MTLRALLAIASLLVVASVDAAPREARCVTPTADPRSTIEDVVDVELEGRILQSLHWTVERTTRGDGTERHAIECDLAIDPTRWSITGTRRGSVAVARDDGQCRFEVIGSGDRVALIPHCASACKVAGGLHALALNLDKGICQPLKR